jgi:membrane protein DedA with SNARE-associated domain
MVGLITHYGLALLFANVLIAMLGLPIPVLPTLIVAGALAVDGEFSALAIFAVVFIAYAIGDATWYAAGRLFGRRVIKLLCQISLSPDSCLRQPEHRFHRWGRTTLVLAKFVPGLSMIMPALAGTMRLDGRTFALFDGVGIALWAGVAISSGMLFHHEIGQLIGRLGEFGTIAVEVIGVLLVASIAIKWWQRHRFYSRLREDLIRSTSTRSTS